MAGLITYSSVLLLTRKRLERVEKLLAGKVRSGSTVRETERQVLFLARQALTALKAGPSPDTSNAFSAGTFTPWLAKGISKFAAMGAVGLEFPREAARLAPGHEWLFETLHHGSPDPSRERVLNACAKFLGFFSARIQTAINADSSISDKVAALATMRAYALGHACAVAGAVVSAPFLDSIEFELGTSTAPARAQLSAAEVSGAVEAAADLQIFGSNTPRRAFWTGWLPTPDEVPDYFFDAYSKAAEDAYGAGARLTGSKAFNDAFQTAEPPAISGRLIKDGYSGYRALIDGQYGWTYGDWLAATIPMFASSMLMFPFASLLKHGRDLRRDDSFFNAQHPKPPTERALYEALTFPFAANALTPVIVSLWITLGSYFGAKKETIFALVNAFVGLLAAILFFVSIAADMQAWVRWIFLFALPLIADIVLMIYVLTRPGDDPNHRKLAYATIPRLGLAVLFIVYFMAVSHIGVEGLADQGFGSGWFWLFFLLWLAMMFGAWLGFAALLVRSDKGGPAPTASAFVTGQPHYLRLFDDTTLYPGSAASPPTPLADLHYPPDRQPLLKLWWTGAGDLYIRSDRSRLVFSIKDNPAAADPVQTVLAPLAPMTAGEYATLLSKAVTEAGAFTAKLKVERFTADEPLDPLLATGEVFADHGDDQTTVEAHETERLKWKKLPKDGEAYVLYLAPRSRQSVRFGRAGERQLTPAEAAIDPGPGRLLAIPAAGAVAVVGTNATRFTETFRIGDVIETTGLSPNQARRVVAITDDKNLTVDAPLAGIPNNAIYRRRARAAVYASHGGELPFDAVAAVDPGPGLLQQIAAPGSVNVVGNANTRFLDLFRIGDVIETKGLATNQARAVTSVTDDRHLTVNVPFTAFAANTAYRRRLRDREFDLAGVGTLSNDSTSFRRITGTGTRFDETFMPGDLIRALPAGLAPETRTVVTVLSATSLEVDLPFTAALPLLPPPAPPPAQPPAAPYLRVGSVAEQGHDYLPTDPTLIFNGRSVLDRAADVATLLCLGVSSHLVPDAERAAVSGNADVTLNRGAIGKAQKVFRDWNLNHRRVNEWRMLVEGRAYSEADSDPTANLLGWAPLLTRWLDMAHRPGTDSHAPTAFRPGDPTNLALSKAMAFLLELPVPA